jgi:hypothetical protein
VEQQQRRCRLPEYVVRNPQGWATGNLSVWGDGAAGFTLPGFRFLPPPSPLRAGLVELKPEEHSVKVEVGLTVRGGTADKEAEPRLWLILLSVSAVCRAGRCGRLCDCEHDRGW